MTWQRERVTIHNLKYKTAAMSMTLQPHLIIISLLSLGYHTALPALSMRVWLGDVCLWQLLSPPTAGKGNRLFLLFSIYNLQFMIAIRKGGGGGQQLVNYKLKIEKRGATCSVSTRDGGGSRRGGYCRRSLFCLGR